MHSCFSQILVYYFCIPAYILRNFCPLHLLAERGGGDIYSLRLGRGLQHKGVIRLTFPLREGSARGATFCGAGTATGGLVSVVFSNMLRKAARNENSQQLIRKLIPSQSQHQQQQQGVKRNKKKEEENDNKIMTCNYSKTVITENITQIVFLFIEGTKIFTSQTNIQSYD